MLRQHKTCSTTFKCDSGQQEPIHLWVGQQGRESDYEPHILVGSAYWFCEATQACARLHIDTNVCVIYLFYSSL